MVYSCYVVGIINVFRFVLCQACLPVYAKPPLLGEAVFFSKVDLVKRVHIRDPNGATQAIAKILMGNPLTIH